MNIEQQVTSLEMSKKLKSLNVKQESVWWWRNDYANNPSKYPDEWYLIPFTDYPLTGARRAVSYEDGDYLLSAFTIAELGEMLPSSTQSYRKKDGSAACSTHKRMSLQKRTKTFFADTEANARAKALIWLIENDYIV